MAAVQILHAPEICRALGISRRTFYRRLAAGWKDGHGFFLESKRGGWCIRDKDLDMLIDGIQNNYFQHKGQHTQSGEQA